MVYRYCYRGFYFFSKHYFKYDPIFILSVLVCCLKIMSINLSTVVLLNVENVNKK